MKKTRITVLKRGYYPDLVTAYAQAKLKPCSLHKEGELFYSNGWRKPDVLCDNTWKCMQEYVMTLSHGGENFFNGWMQNPKIAVVSCNDGTRPVSFLLEATDVDAHNRE